MTRTATGDVCPTPARIPHSAFRIPHSKGVTLIELLIAIAILGVIAGLILGVGAVAQETAREAQTRSTILRIHTLLVEHLDTYRNRRVSLSTGAENEIDDETGQLRGQLTAEARLHALREIMLTELPERWSDVLLNAVPANPATAPINTTVNAPLYAEVPSTTRRTSIGNIMLREYQRVAQSTNANTGSANTRTQLLQNQSAECLFMIVMLTTGNGEAPGLFGDRVIGDTDGDGAREFLDGWGNPIRFLRWAPGVDSPTQLSIAALQRAALDNNESATVTFPNGTTGTISDAQAIANAVNQNRDPFDLFRLQRYTTTQAAPLLDNNADNDADGAFGYSLLPLVYSTGGDEESGIVDDENLPSPATPTDLNTGYVAWTGVAQALNVTSGSFTPDLVPYRRLVVNDAPSDPHPAINRQIGATLNDFATDNVTNHLITARASK